MSIKGFKNSQIGKFLKLNQIGKKQKPSKESKLASSHLSTQKATTDPRKISKGRVKKQKSSGLLSRGITRLSRTFFSEKQSSPPKKERTSLLGMHRQSTLLKKTTGPKKKSVLKKEALSKLAKEEKAIQNELSEIRGEFHQLIQDKTNFKDLKPREKYQNVVLDTYGKLEDKDLEPLKQKLLYVEQRARHTQEKRQELGRKGSPPIDLHAETWKLMQEIKFSAAQNISNSEKKQDTVRQLQDNVLKAQKSAREMLAQKEI